jgi:hypothetical protein
MNRRHILRLTSTFILFASLGLADTITFRDGRTVNGSFVGGDTRTVRFAVGSRVDNYSVTDISTISFDGGGSASTPAAERREDRREERRDAQSDAAVLPSGTVLTVRMIDSVDSQRDQVGRTFRASLDEPVVDSNGNTLVRRGADVWVKLVDDQQSGKIAGRTVLTLDLVSLDVNGRTVDINTEAVTEKSGSRTGRSAKVIGGTAALGAIIGAIAGGGKGAAIGAGAGAGVGTAAEVATKGQRVHIPSETRLTFTLQQPVRL